MLQAIEKAALLREEQRRKRAENQLQRGSLAPSSQSPPLRDRRVSLGPAPVAPPWATHDDVPAAEDSASPPKPGARKPGRVDPQRQGGAKPPWAVASVQGLDMDVPTTEASAPAGPAPAASSHGLAAADTTLQQHSDDPLSRTLELWEPGRSPQPDPPRAYSPHARVREEREREERERERESRLAEAEARALDAERAVREEREARLALERRIADEMDRREKADRAAQAEAERDARERAAVARAEAERERVAREEEYKAAQQREKVATESRPQPQL